MELGALVSGRFRIEREVGSGGMGTVFRARDELSGTHVAVKALHQNVPEGTNRFSREIAALARMSHPSIVRYVAHGDAPPFVAMEWLEGEDLAQRLRSGPLPVHEAIEIAARTAEAIDHAHTLGIVHRDLKPSNLFFEHGEVSGLRVVDFGLAYMADVEFKSSTGVLLGTPGYMAPEQVRGEAVDARADVFSLACVLYKCVTGRGPFSAPGDAVATLAKVLFQEPEPASSLRAGVPRALDALLSRALSKDRAGRPQSARAFAEELRWLERADEPSEAHSIAAPPSSAMLTDRERRILSVVVAAREGLGEEISTLRCEVETMFLERQQALRDIAAKHGARLEILPVAIVAVLDGRGSATDRAAAGARLALAMREVLGGVPIALATGSAEVGRSRDGRRDRPSRRRGHREGACQRRRRDRRHDRGAPRSRVRGEGRRAPCSSSTRSARRRCK